MSGETYVAGAEHQMSSMTTVRDLMVDLHRAEDEREHARAATRSAEDERDEALEELRLLRSALLRLWRRGQGEK